MKLAFEHVSITDFKTPHNLVLYSVLVFARNLHHQSGPLMQESKRN